MGDALISRMGGESGEREGRGVEFGVLRSWRNCRLTGLSFVRRGISEKTVKFGGSEMLLKSCWNWTTSKCASFN